MSINRATDEESHQEKFFKHGIQSLESYISDLFNHVVCLDFPSSCTRHMIHPIHKSWSNFDWNNHLLSSWVLHSPRFMSQSYTSGLLRSQRAETLGLEDKQVSTQTTRRLITYSQSEPLLRRLIITHQRSTIALQTSKKHLTQFQGRRYSRDSVTLEYLRPS